MLRACAVVLAAGLVSPGAWGFEVPVLRAPGLVAQPASAGTGGERSASPIEERKGPPPVSFELGLRSTFIFNTDLKDGGDVSVTRVAPSVGARFVFKDRSALSVRLEFEYNNYDFSGATGLGPRPSEPWKDIYRESLNVSYLTRVGERGTLLVGGRFGLDHEDGAKLGKSFEVGGFVAYNYTLSETLSLGFGVGVFSQIEDDVLVIPLPVIDWKFAPKWQLTNNNRPGIFVVYQPLETLEVSAGFEYQTRDFRLSEDNAVKNGVGRDRRFPVSLGVVYTPTRRIELELRGGVDVAAKYWLLDENGTRLASKRSDPSPFLSGGFTFRF